MISGNGSGTRPGNKPGARSGTTTATSWYLLQAQRLNKQEANGPTAWAKPDPFRATVFNARQDYKYMSVASLSLPVGFPRNKQMPKNTEGKAMQTETSYELRLQGSCWHKNFQDDTDWFRFPCDLLAESHPFAYTRSWLVSALNHAHARDGALARFLHL